MSAPIPDPAYAALAQTTWVGFVKGAVIAASAGVIILTLMAITLL